MPPRHGKSETISRRVPAWFLDLWPEKRVMLASYAASFASTWSRKVRDDLKAAYAEGLVRCQIHPGSRRAAEWLTTAGGGMVASGVGGSFTGRGADLLILDDPIKNAEEGNSQVYRDNTWNWYQSVAATRLEPGAITVILMTRWHEDDIIGRLLKEAAEGGAPVHRLRLPAICEDGDDPTERLLGRQTGDALWPQRFDVVQLASIKLARGPYVWAALYQQRPMPMGGLLFKAIHFRYWTTDSVTGFYILHHGEDEGGDEFLDPQKCRRFGTTDLAVSLKETADYTAIGGWAASPKKDLLLLGLRRMRLEGPDHLPAIEQMIQKHKLGFMGIESTQYQMALLQAAKRKGLAVKELKPDKDKLQRALPAAARTEAHTVFFPLVFNERDDFELEVLAFPNGSHDDMVDIFSYAVGIVVDGTFLVSTAPKSVGVKPSQWGRHR